MSTVEPVFTVVTHVILLRPAAQELFLLKRRDGVGPLDGMHVPPGGHLQVGETVWDAARREVREETGVVLDPDPGASGTGLVAVLTWDGGAPEHQGVNVVFCATAWTGQPVLAEPERFASARFHRAEALPESLLPWVRDTAALAVAGETAGTPAFGAYRWD